jgi:hypothetical protein
VPRDDLTETDGLGNNTTNSLRILCLAVRDRHIQTAERTRIRLNFKVTQSDVPTSGRGSVRVVFQGWQARNLLTCMRASDRTGEWGARKAHRASWNFTRPLTFYSTQLSARNGTQNPWQSSGKSPWRDMRQVSCRSQEKRNVMNGIIYIVGFIVVVMAALSVLGLR